MKPVLAALLICALAGACSVRSNTVVEKPVPARTAVVVPADSSTSTTSTVVVRN